MDYPFENLGPESFQSLCQALLAREYRNLQIFPLGQPDGGRDAIAFLTGNDGREYVVFQIKYVREKQERRDSRKWLERTLRDEVPKIARLIPKGATRYILITNVAGTGHANTGSIDDLQSILNTLPLPGQCWVEG